MAPSQKRKKTSSSSNGGNTAYDDGDFVYTIPDDADLPNEEAIEESTSASAVEERPKKKAKTMTTAAATGKKSKNKNKKQRTNAVKDVDGEEAWGGARDEDDGAIASDFEFDADEGLAGDAFATEDFEGWGFDGAKKAVVAANGGDKKAVDIDAIIRRRRERKEEKKEGAGKMKADEEVDAAAAAAAVEEDEEMEVDFDDEDDEVLADDAFGMGAGSDDEESGEAEEEDSEGEDAEEGSDEEEDDEDIESEVSDAAAAAGNKEDEGSDSEAEEEDEEEAARRKEFFAPEVETKGSKVAGPSSFVAMSLSRPILKGLHAVGFERPTPIQAKTIPISLMGKDIVGGAVTGSGKTAAFVVPILERLLFRNKRVPTTRVVILTPTRELAIQCHAVATKLAGFTDIRFCLAVGGLSLKVQEAELRLRPDVVIATPGRFIDHMRNSASFAVDSVEILVLDEADRMLEDGFADELNEILTTLPKSRQTMLFSATMTSNVDKLIRVGMTKPVRIMVDSEKKMVGTLIQEFVRLRPGRVEKRMGYLVHICKTLYKKRVIIFFRQKKLAHRARIIFGLLGLSCAELHGSMKQAQVCNIPDPPFFASS
jgi:ATP-dependent RNA helicase DDX27